ncbi:LAFA_0B05468g1_1 [Lachancea sp. 'fantastica']|nr:LAFA_0B05468g1_1 [Lachancea sp. 'fantastica']
MDFDKLLHQLEPLLDNGAVSRIRDDPSTAEYSVSTLSQLAISLRAPNNRDVLRESGVYGRLLELFDSALQNNPPSHNVIAVLTELIRCLANCLADNDPNRVIFMAKYVNGKEADDSSLVNLLTLGISGVSCSNHTLKFRSLALIKNLCLENKEYTEACSSVLTTALFQVLQSYSVDTTDEDELDSIAMAADLLFEFTEFSFMAVSRTDPTILVQLLRRVAPRSGLQNSNENSSDEEDAHGEISQLLAGTLEGVLSKNDTLDFKDANATHKLQSDVLEALAVLEAKPALENKLIIMRRLVSVAGLISANRSNSNLQDRDMCYQIIREAIGGYTIAAALIILSNCVSSRQSADEVSQHVPLSLIIHKCQAFRDPVQFQGFLDLLKKLLNLSNAHELQEPDLTLLSLQLKTCHDQCQYFQNLAPLVDALLDKVVAVLPGSVLRKILADDNFKTVITERGGIATALLIDKLVLQRRGHEDNALLATLWTSLFRSLQNSSVSQSQGISTPFLFQLMKSLGIYLRSLNASDPNPVFESHSHQLSMLFDTIASLATKTDPASKSIYNNARFVAGMTINLLRDQTGPVNHAQLLESATQLLTDTVSSNSMTTT